MLRHKFFKTIAFRKIAADLDAWDDVDDLKELLDKNPEHGDLISGGFGLRKVRMTLRAKGRGTRGGARVIYYQVLRDRVLLLVYLYSKSVKSDLTKEELEKCIEFRDAAVREIMTKLKEEGK